ncbi:MAG TPA: prephenate dehydrogenase/arogenate dehydrogenase family protein [Thermodesulfobacteriota bacterium]|nr:prephenate dehydrogenase/arogenate dehydrogenase family protein [Thermodesulfobacteriota bacterium]
MSNSTNPHFKKTAVIGVGLIGGSLAVELRSEGLTDEIVGIGRGRANLETALSLGVVDSVTTDVAQGVEGADLVVVSVPVLKIADVIRMAAPVLTPPCIIMDVGSVKKAVIDAVEPLVPEGVRFVPTHPIAGTEDSGAGAAFKGLFKDRLCVLTPTDNTDKEALEAVRSVWRLAGSNIVEMDAVTHDRIFAAVSHLPHMIAYTLVNTVAAAGGDETDMVRFSAGGFRDFTRIASSSPEMWTDICVMNSEFIVEMMDNFSSRLEVLKRLISRGDLDGIKEEFRKAKKVRDSLISEGWDEE